MLNLLTKTKPWMVASLIAATSVFGQNNASCPKPCPPKPCPKPCPQPCPPTQVCSQDPCCPSWQTPVLNAAYNYPARTQTRCPWDVNFDVSFIYWQALQENMELGINNTTASIEDDGVNGKMINMNFGFKPGFKIGMGVNYDNDNWDSRLEYTWFHATNNTSFQKGDVGTLLPADGHPASIDGATFNALSKKWNLKMDIIDLDLGRWCYVGTKLTFRPNFGARADWIRQKVVVNQTATANVGLINGRSSSWAIGPKAGLDTNWVIGSGFRVFGNAEADLLFTKYTRLSFNESHSNAVATPYAVRQDRVYALRPHMDLELGLGWGTYLDCNNWYMDFTAGYDFQVFFDQNVFRHFNDDSMIANSTMPNGNLYTQGLTATFRLDF